jgi:pimeloyl-ACP methyl ester carboxylesterase
LPAAQAVVVGNSIGSLACVCAAASNPPSIAGVGLFNCAIGMNSKAPPLPEDPAAYVLFFNLIGESPCDPPRNHFNPVVLWRHDG